MPQLSRLLYMQIVHKTHYSRYYSFIIMAIQATKTTCFYFSFFDKIKILVLVYFSIDIFLHQYIFYKHYLKPIKDEHVFIIFFLGFMKCLLIYNKLICKDFIYMYVSYHYFIIQIQLFFSSFNLSQYFLPAVNKLQWDASIILAWLNHVYFKEIFAWHSFLYCIAIVYQFVDKNNFLMQ